MMPILLPYLHRAIFPHAPQTQQPMPASQRLLFLRVTGATSAALLLTLTGGVLLFNGPILGPALLLPAKAATTCPGSTPSSPITTISLNEVLTNPDKDWNGNGKVDKIGDQWIELANLGSNPFQMPLQVCDSSSGLVLLPISLLIPAHGFAVIYGSQFTPSFPLFPGGGQLELLDGAGLPIESVNYAPLGSDLSYSRTTNGGWSVTSTPTPGATNSINPPGSPTPTPTRTPKPTATPRSGKGGSGGGGSGGKATPTSTPVPAGNVVFPTGSALALQQDDSSPDSAGSQQASSPLPAWLKIVLLLTLGGGLLAVVIWYIRSWTQEPEGEG